jgi:hypothetical protein
VLNLLSLLVLLVQRAPRAPRAGASTTPQALAPPQVLILQGKTSELTSKTSKLWWRFDDTAGAGAAAGTQFTCFTCFTSPKV